MPDSGLPVAYKAAEAEASHDKSSGIRVTAWSRTARSRTDDRITAAGHGSRVAYRTTREGPCDIVFLPNWFTCCEVFPELPPIQGWVEAMTSLGRLIFFDQPGSGASDPVTPGALPTLEQWGDRHHRGVSFLRAAARSGTRPTGSVTGL